MEEWKWVVAEYSSDNGKTWNIYYTHMIEPTLEESIERIKNENGKLLFRNFRIEEDNC